MMVLEVKSSKLAYTVKEHSDVGCKNAQNIAENFNEEDNDECQNAKIS